MAISRWSTTPINNELADPVIPVAEGIGARRVNDAIRSVMSELRKYDLDISGVLETQGNASGLTLATHQNFGSGGNPLVDGVRLRFRPHVTSDANPTLSLDGGPEITLRDNVGAVLRAGELLLGRPIEVMYFEGVNQFRLLADSRFAILNDPFFDLPVGSIFMHMSDTIPARFVVCDGRFLSRAEYSELFRVIGGSYGSDSTRFRVPDVAGLFPRFRGHRDPDKDTRIARPDGQGGDRVGTTQGSVFGDHNHTGSIHNGGYVGQRTSSGHTEGFAGFGFGGNDLTSVLRPGSGDSSRHTLPAIPAHAHGLTINSNGGAETRPFNINVCGIIYAGVTAP